LRRHSDRSGAEDSAARKRDVVLRLLWGESIETVSRQLAVEPYRLAQWRERALAALDAGLKDRAEDDPVQAGLGAVYKRLGELGMENELLREKIARLEAACLFTGRGRADQRGDLACHLPELRRAARLPHLGSPALVVLPCHPSRRGGTPRGTPWPGAAGGGGPFAERHPSRLGGLAIPR
jgi:transposase